MEELRPREELLGCPAPEKPRARRCSCPAPHWDRGWPLRALTLRAEFWRWAVLDGGISRDPFRLLRLCVSVRCRNSWARSGLLMQHTVVLPAFPVTALGIKVAPSTRRHSADAKPQLGSAVQPIRKAHVFHRSVLGSRSSWMQRT